MNVIFLTLTALSVSVDSFFAGVALSIKNKRSLSSILCVLTTVLILCLSGALLGKIFGDFLKNYAQILAGIILILVGGIGILKKERQTDSKSNSIKKSIVVGISVWLDGAVGSFSLTAIGYNGILVAVLITFIHVLLLILAFLLGGKISKKLRRESKIPSITLIVLGLYKLIT